MKTIVQGSYSVTDEGKCSVVLWLYIRMFDSGPNGPGFNPPITTAPLPQFFHGVTFLNLGHQFGQYVSFRPFSTLRLYILVKLTDSCMGNQDSVH